MLIWIIQYRMKEQEHDNIYAFADDIKAKEIYEKLKNDGKWDYVTISVHQV